MKKISFNTENLKLKKLQLMKNRVSNLTNENMMEVLGGGGATAYYSCASPNGCESGFPPTQGLASCLCSTFPSDTCTTISVNTNC